MTASNTGRLKEIGKYKNDILLKLLDSEEIVKAVYYKEPNFLDMPMPEDKYSLLFNNLYPYRYVPGTIETEQKTFISLMFSGLGLSNRMFKFSTITFYVFTHYELCRTDYDTLRYDYIANKIDEIFNENKNLGIGLLRFSGGTDFEATKDHFGFQLSYKNTEFN